jgi:transitional endoplasmic reticulum ATPase
MRQPSVLVIEEIDFIAPGGKQAAMNGRDLFYTLLSELDQIDDASQSLLIVATTNKIDDVDKSLRRGGRLDIDIRFDMPSSADRFEILKSHLSQLTNTEVGITNDDLTLIARAASGFVSSDLA